MASATSGSASSSLYENGTCGVYGSYLVTCDSAMAMYTPNGKHRITGSKATTTDEFTFDVYMEFCHTFEDFGCHAALEVNLATITSFC